ncbi:tRNA threonylcarbamoyladenosine biosynthesis protein TsaE [Roseivivax jejudonensis]|uniref:tRNA threonylcarbamoyladenosine biosynthesis protein TsaE n=2 Tax=Roseivivax jejudonensis TaxID=1529041 RepID=A0A1X6YLH4_9RHOB|nr:tRNA (adenosine(37)-N6)-threonylcarbamoyltransferase complex ATPase subunit type 1 TsaE [Roseivivax jejudonensis]SLN24620.1 tRNA threonylcarbamoyladenosine biosynthesis protein TsaE [Roseivivax jejudonensis]
MTASAPDLRLPLFLPDPDATAAVATALGARLEPGDTILLEGGLGAGKTHFARALIQSRLVMPEDVPSPTFTLVQVYETGSGEIWHADLYRLSGPEEVIELGLDAAFDTAICLVEWPDRLGDMAPADALRLTLEPEAEGDGRVLHARWSAARWADRLSGVLA